MQGITEILHGPMGDVKNDAVLLGLDRYPGEKDQTFRERTAYALQKRMMEAEGRVLSAKIVQRMVDLDLQAQLEKDVENETN